MDYTTNLFCSDDAPKVCYTATQELLDYIDTSATKWGELIDKQAGVNMLFIGVIAFFVIIMGFKSLIKW